MFTLCHIIICDALCLKNSSWFHCHYFLSCVQRFASSSVMAILQFHLENWPGFGMTINPANKAVYINPAREPDMNFIKFLTWTCNEYNWFLPTLAYFRHQHFLSYKGSKPPRSQPSSTQRALSQEEMCAFMTRNGSDPSIWFNLPCTWSHCELWNFKNHTPKKWSAFYWGGDKQTYSSINMFDTWPDRGKRSISYMWLSITSFE